MTCKGNSFSTITRGGFRMFLGEIEAESGEAALAAAVAAMPGEAGDRALADVRGDLIRDALLALRAFSGGCAALAKRPVGVALPLFHRAPLTVLASKIARTYALCRPRDSSERYIHVRSAHLAFHVRRTTTPHGDFTRLHARADGPDQAGPAQPDAPKTPHRRCRCRFFPWANITETTLSFAEASRAPSKSLI